MKKIIIAISLSAIMLLCGCGTDMGSVAVDTEPQVSITPEATLETPTGTSEAMQETSATEIPEAVKAGMALFGSVMERVQKNIDTGTFEGFTEESTFLDVAAADMELNYARDTFAVDFLDFPANISYDYNLDQNRLEFYIFSDERTGYKRKISKLIGKLDKVLGRHTQESGASYNYKWQTDAYPVYVQTKAASFEEAGTLARVLFEHMDKRIAPAEIPGIFCDLFGVEYTPEYENKMQALVNNKNRINYLAYLDDDILIRFMFMKVGEINNLFNLGEYEFSIDMSDADSALCYMEACLDTLNNIFGEPKSLLYHSYGTDIVKTAEEVKQLGWDKFRVQTFWEKGITMNIMYNGETVGFSISFGRNNF